MIRIRPRRLSRNAHRNHRRQVCDSIVDKCNPERISAHLPQGPQDHTRAFAVIYRGPYRWEAMRCGSRPLLANMVKHNTTHSAPRFSSSGIGAKTRNGQMIIVVDEEKRNCSISCYRHMVYFRDLSIVWLMMLNLWSTCMVGFLCSVRESRDIPNGVIKYTVLIYNKNKLFCCFKNKL